MSLKSRLKKKLKKLGKSAKKTIKKVGKAAGTVMRFAAPVVAAVIPGMQGVAIAGASAIAGSALKGGNRKKKLKALARTGSYVGAAVVAKGALGLAAGKGVGASVIESVPSIVGSVFGGGESAPPPSKLEDSFIDPRGVGSAGMSGDTASKLAAAVGLGASVLSGAGPGGIGAGAPGQTVEAALAGDRGGGPFGDSFGTVDPGLDASAGGLGGINPLWIAVGLGAVFLLTRKK